MIAPGDAAVYVKMVGPMDLPHCMSRGANNGTDPYRFHRDGSRNPYGGTGGEPTVPYNLDGDEVEILNPEAHPQLHRRQHCFSHLEGAESFYETAAKQD
jgi:hypothetical protein